MGMEVEDDVFFADLSKQISLLIMDDDEQDEFPLQSPSLHFQGYDQRMMRQAMMPPLAYNQNMYEMGSYTLSSSRESKGTGVFIPRSSYPRRKPHIHNAKSKCSSNGASQRKSARAALHSTAAASADVLRSKSSGPVKNRN
ncbi:uncharacterized protein LOC109850539 [Asparagus officinalis]|uniref:uncharacterized protein LOC109850539 n=1 Tax=Asparagus officinalis TaxID=4686 RepID=UPI00098DEBFE|nr:uncharacterized protein LOC109850539 [Asparagus officinalis]